MNAAGSTWYPPAALAPRRTPEAFVRAEVASFPLTHLEGFRRATVVLDPRLDAGDAAGAGDTRSRTSALWRACEETLVEHASGWSLDRIVAVRDHSWFSDRGRGGTLAPVPLHRYLRRLASGHLRCWTPVTEVRLSSRWDQLDAITHYRWLIFALPEDLLLAALEVEPPPVAVDLDPPLLKRRLIDSGVAEIHHHIGAGMDFPLLWTAALAHLASPELEPEALAGPGMPFDDGKAFVTWLLAAAVARTALAELLIRRRGGGGAPRDLADLFRQLEDWIAKRSDRHRLLRALSRAVGALRNGEDASLPDFHDLRQLYGELHPQAAFDRLGPPRSLAEVWRRCDPVAARLALSGANAGERWWVRNGLAYLEEGEASGRPDPLFADLFWQVLRLRIQYYRAVVQRPMTAGLQWFIRFYGRISALRAPLDRVAPEVSFHTAAGGHVLTALEARTSPGRTGLETAETMRDFVVSWKRVLESVGTGRAAARAEPEFGVVLHLVKGRDPWQAWSGGRPPAYGSGTYAEPHPRDGLRAGRFADYLADQSARAWELGALLRAVPLALWLVRGLDVASDEISVPTWVLTPLFRSVRDQGAVAASDPRARGAEPLRVTAHVGEDFRHLSEGLRRIFECVLYLLGNHGRLGHATALGVEPRSWAESVGSVMMPAEERLWDLVWEWRLYTGFRRPPEFAAEAPPGRQGQVETRIRELATLVFRKSYDPGPLAELQHVLHYFLTPPVADVVRDGSLTYERAVRRLRRDKVQHAGRVLKLLEAYCYDQGTFERGQKLVDVTLDGSEVAALDALQNAMRRGVGYRGLVVEVNPSSNLLIGDLLDLRHHPILRLFPPEPAEGPPPVPIAIGSDDPLTFSTHLLREYALLFDAARTAGYPERVVQDWLERIRITGLDARFTLPWRPSARKVADDLIDAFDDFLQRPRIGRHPRRAGAIGD